MQALAERHSAPHASLQRWVTSIATVGDARKIGGLPSLEALYLPRIESSILVRWTRGGQAVVSALGPLTRARRKALFAPRPHLRVALRPGQARALLGGSVEALADQVVPLQDLWGDSAQPLRDELSGRDLASARRLLETALVAQAQTASRPVPHAALLQQTIARLQRGDLSVAVLADSLGLSERHLRRLFHEELGMSPKRLGRVLRLQRVLAQMGASPDWTDLALGAGFHDQSHLIREFRALVGATPQVYRAAAFR